MMSTDVLAYYQMPLVNYHYLRYIAGRACSIDWKSHGHPVNYRLHELKQNEQETARTESLMADFLVMTFKNRRRKETMVHVTAEDPDSNRGCQSAVWTEQDPLYSRFSHYGWPTQSDKL